MTGSTRGNTVLITGGSGGLGLAMARHFRNRGHEVFVCGRTQSALDRAADVAPGVHPIRADVADATDRVDLLAAITTDAGTLDILVNNAAITRAHDYTDDFTLAADRARDELEINLAAPIELTRMFLAWRRSSGRDDTPASIVNVSTPGALFPLEANTLYCATKAGLHLFTLGLRRQLASTPVTVIGVFPPALDTNLAHDLIVANQAANGPDVVDAVARITVDGVLAGSELILPHPEAEQLYSRFAVDFDDVLLDQINAGVSRRAGWNAEPAT
jgi:uncharacterized oxidoreductase